EQQAMRDEVEGYRERPLAVRHGRGGEPARGDIERDVPPVVLHRRQREPRLADDLGPHVQGRVRVLPLGERQGRPGGMCAHGSYSNDTRWESYSSREDMFRAFMDMLE